MSLILCHKFLFLSFFLVQICWCKTKSHVIYDKQFGNNVKDHLNFSILAFSTNFFFYYTYYKLFWVNCYLNSIIYSFILNIKLWYMVDFTNHVIYILIQVKHYFTKHIKSNISGWMQFYNTQWKPNSFFFIIYYKPSAISLYTVIPLLQAECYFTINYEHNAECYFIVHQKPDIFDSKSNYIQIISGLTPYPMELFEWKTFHE